MNLSTCGGPLRQPSEPRNSSSACASELCSEARVESGRGKVNNALFDLCRFGDCDARRRGLVSRLEIMTRSRRNRRPGRQEVLHHHACAKSSISSRLSPALCAVVICVLLVSCGDKPDTVPPPQTPGTNVDRKSVVSGQRVDLAG